MNSDRISVRAIVDFIFDVDDDLTVAEMIEEFEDRIRSGEYFPHNVLDVDINAPSFIPKGA